jgi:hypothetical protein
MNSALLLAMVISGYDWVGVSIETGKHSESMSQRYFHSEQECRSSNILIGDDDDRVCFPVPTLPKEVWDEQNNRDRLTLKAYYERCIISAKNSWTQSGMESSLRKCEQYNPKN